VCYLIAAFRAGVATVQKTRAVSLRAKLPKEKRRTVTNVRTYDTTNEERKKTGKPAEPLTSGLLGPVTLQMAQ